MFFVSVPRGPNCLPNIFHCASQMFTLIPVYYASFVGDVVFILEGHYEIIDGVAPLEMKLDSYFITNSLETFIQVF